MMAVRYLHSIGVAHRNIKLENVLLSEDGERIKVTPIFFFRRVSRRIISSSEACTCRLEMLAVGLPIPLALFFFADGDPLVRLPL